MSDPDVDTNPAETDDGCDRFPASFAQLRLWFIDRLLPDRALYNVPVRFDLEGPVDPVALAGSLADLIRRHESLRTRFEEHDGSVLQVVGPPVEPPLSMIEPESDEALEREVFRLACLPFDLSRGPLLRTYLLRRGDDRQVLLIVLHHVICDAWSIAVLCRELSAAYAARCHARSPIWPELPIQYADYAVWQQQRLSGEATRRSLAYWAERLKAAATLELPTDRPRPAEFSYRGGRFALQLPLRLTEDLKRLGLARQATLFMVLVSAFQCLLYRLGGQTDILVGVPIAGRTRPELEGLIGLFVNTLVLRADLGGNPRYADLLDRVRDDALKAHEHQEMPFEQWVEALAPPRDLSRHPIFQVMFVMQNMDEAMLDLNGTAAVATRVDTRTAKFDLSLNLQETPVGLQGWIEYASDLFDAASIERLAGQYVQLLRGIAADPNTAIDALPLLTDSERRQILFDWNETAAAFPSTLGVHQLFERQAERTPKATAVMFRGETLSYGELDRRAQRLAGHLRRQGVAADRCVAICLSRGPELVVGLLAILKAGGAYVPLDPGHPPERLAYLLTDCAPVAVLVDRRTRDLVARVCSGAVRVDLDEDRAAWETAPDDEPDPAAIPFSSHQLAYVIHTSGSTGQPKGVMVEHRSLVNHIVWQTGRFELTSADRFLQRTALSFDASVWELWTPLAIGAAMVLVPDEDLRDPTALIALIREARVSVAQFVPSLLQMLCEAAAESQTLDCRLLFSGGEPLTAALATRARRMFAGSLVNLYGPTEATIDSTFWICPDDAVPERVPIGRPIANARVYLLDAAGNPVPIGVTGELHIGGEGLARGYLNRPELTAAQFLPDPFSAVPGARMYRTGDLGCWNADGSIVFLGRRDFQVKLRGYRIELGEIEARLSNHPGVRAAVAVVRADGPGGDRLIAYVVADPDLPVEGLRAYLLEALPDYMVPARIVRLAAMPLTPSGKIDRAALPAPEEPSAARRSEAPQTATEAALAAIWSEVLQRGSVGIDEDFFALGGHSLLLLQTAARIRQRLGVDLPLRVLFEAPTVAALAKRVEAAAKTSAAAATGSIVPLGDTHAKPLSFAQQRLWVVERLWSPGAAYHLPIAWRLRGHIDRLALEAALNDLIARHAMLRTRYREQDGGISQEAVDPFPPLHLAVHRLDHSAMLDAALHDAAVEAFDLTEGPWLRAALFRLADDDQVLLIGLHHISCDGWSLAVLARELSARYAAHVHGEPAPLARLSIQYADYAVWQRQSLDGERRDRQLAFWVEQLANVAPLALPTDRPRPARFSFRGRRVPVQVPAAISESLRKLARTEEVTLFMLLLAAFQVLLGRLGGQDDVAVGTPTAGRTQPELEGLIGLFVNTLVMRADLTGNPPFRELLRRVRDTALAAQDHQDLPFELLVEALQPERDTSRHPLFQVMFVLQNTADAELRLAAVESEPIAIDTNTAKFELTLNLRDSPAGLTGTLEYASDLFDHTTACRFVEHYQTLLESIVADVSTPIGVLPILPEAERKRLMNDWSGRAVAYPDRLGIHQLFAAQAAATPDAIAVVTATETIRYGELDARANRLAHDLRELGVGPEVPVGISLARTPNLVVGLLAILKAGGAYLPLDPGYPSERLEFMLVDAGAPVLLTETADRPRFPGFGGRVVCLDEAAAAVDARLEQDAPEDAPAGSRLAYIIYTSGSTGTPKGVEVRHHSVARLVFGQDYAHFGPDETFLLLAPISFDASTFELWGALLHGARCVLHPERVPTLDGLERTIREYGVTTLWLTAALFNTVIDNRPELLAPLRQLLTGGEALSPVHVRRALERLPNTRLINGYGPTESTTFTCCQTLDLSLVTDDGPVPIGTPIANTEVYLLDRHLNPVPVGVPGELHIGGAGLARGYLKRPELNAEKFIPHPFKPDRAERLYKTGDLARFREDGRIECLGRLDRQVKLRGFRIELGEIEAALAGHPGVREAVVLLRREPPGEPRLVSYLTLEPDVTLDGGTLEAFLQARLPAYCVPAAFVFLPRLPLTANGKVDHAALPSPLQSTAATGGGPTDQIELHLCKIWESVLGRRGVRPDQNFFELGGTSLLAVTLMDRTKQVFGRDLPLDTLWYDAGSVTAIARLLRGAPAELKPSPLVKIKPGDRRPPLFCVHTMGGNLFHYDKLASRLDPEQPVFGLQARGVYGTETPDAELRDIAADCVATLRQAQAVGPYRLAGFSSGGVVAFEMTRQLLAAGESVAVLALIDTYAPGTTARDHWLRLLKKLLNPAQRHEVLERFYVRVLPVLGLAGFRRLLSIGETHRWAHWRYRPQRLAADAVLYLAEGSRTTVADPTLGWGKWIGGVLSVITIPGDHGEIVHDPSVTELATHLQSLLDRSVAG